MDQGSIFRCKACKEVLAILSKKTYLEGLSYEKSSRPLAPPITKKNFDQSWQFD